MKDPLAKAFGQVQPPQKTPPLDLAALNWQTTA